jgi:hypothetical protein
MSRSTQVFNLSLADDEDYLDFASSSTVSKPVEKAPATIIAKTKKKAAYKPMKELPDNYDLIDDLPTVSAEKANKKIPLKSVQEHQLLINQLNAFASSVRFAPVLKEFDIKIKDLSKKTLGELKELRERVRACCANSGGTGGIVSAVTLGMCSGLEAAMPKKLLDLDGYRAQVEANPEFAALCEMIEIDSGFKTSMNPMQRMALCLGSTALSVGGANKMRATAQNASAALLSSLKAQQQTQQSPASAAPIVAPIVPPEEPIRVY